MESLKKDLEDFKEKVLEELTRQDESNFRRERQKQKKIQFDHPWEIAYLQWYVAGNHRLRRASGRKS